jgi:hypothetical protein
MDAMVGACLTRRSRVVAILAIVGAAGACRSHAASATDLDGNPATLQLDSAATVVVFLATDCPISTRYLPELARLGEGFATRGVAFDAIYPGTTETGAAVRDHAHDLGAAFRPLLDPRHALVHAAGATVTPEAAVYDAHGTLAYLGRIDDRFVDFGRARAAATRHDLADAIDAVLDGRTPVVAPAPPVGCAIAEDAAE